MSSTFSHAYWSFGYIPWRNVYLDSFFLFLSGVVCLFIIELYESFICSRYKALIGRAEAGLSRPCAHAQPPHVELAVGASWRHKAILREEGIWASWESAGRRVVPGCRGVCGVELAPSHLS